MGWWFFKKKGSKSRRAVEGPTLGPKKAFFRRGLGPSIYLEMGFSKKATLCVGAERARPILPNPSESKDRPVSEVEWDPKVTSIVGFSSLETKP